MNNDDFIFLSVRVTDNIGNEIDRDTMIRKDQIVAILEHSENYSYLYLQGIANAIVVNMPFSDLCIKLFNN